jgi:hypothetical protein
MTTETDNPMLRKTRQFAKCPMCNWLPAAVIEEQVPVRLICANPVCKGYGRSIKVTYWNRRAKLLLRTQQNFRGSNV